MSRNISARCRAIALASARIARRMWKVSAIERSYGERRPYMWDRHSGTEFNVNRLRYQAVLPCVIHQALHGATASVAILQCELVHVHADEPVGFSAIETSAELQRVIERFLTMAQRVRDAGVQDP